MHVVDVNLISGLSSSQYMSTEDVHMSENSLRHNNPC